MQHPGPNVQKIKVPTPVIQALQRQVQMQTMNVIANAIVTGDYEGSEIIPDAHKRLIGDMILTLSQNRALETAKCEHCSEIRLEHPLDLATGERYCKDEHQPKPTEDDPTLIPTKNLFKPVMPKIVAPPGAQRPGLIIPGRG